MGFLDKVKGFFTDEPEEQVKSEVRQVEIPAPTREIKQELKNETKIEPIIETKKEQAAPIFFDDAYFKELEQPKKEIKSSYLKEQTKIKEEKRQFHPTPIISPVYGVLDKNYNKEDITSKKNKTKAVSYTNTSISIDEVRKKAYGTLEDDLENTLFSSFKGKEENDDLFDELIDKDETIDIIEDNLVEENMNKTDKPISESELFDLIDSMYDKGD